MSETERAIDVEAVITQFCDDVNRHLDTRFNVWRPDFAHIQVHEVIGAMIARQATLAKEVAGNPSIWNGHAAPILLRAMADVHINVAWLLLDPIERCLKFISFGLGQAKLELEHRRAEIGSRDLTNEDAALFDAMQRWIDTQRSSFLLDVDLGKWSALSVRDMAKEAACLDFYNFVYTPFSACAHSMWHHVAKYNLVACENPLHRYHLRPTSRTFEPDFHYVLLAAKYFDKTLTAFDQRFGVTIARPSAYDGLRTAVAVEAPSPPIET